MLFTTIMDAYETENNSRFAVCFLCEAIPVNFAYELHDYFLTLAQSQPCENMGSPRWLFEWENTSHANIWRAIMSALCYSKIALTRDYQ